MNLEKIREVLETNPPKDSNLEYKSVELVYNQEGSPIGYKVTYYDKSTETNMYVEFVKRDTKLIEELTNKFKASLEEKSESNGEISQM